MPDPLDNTFPMPATDDTSSQVAGSVAVPADSPISASASASPAYVDPGTNLAPVVEPATPNPNSASGPVSPDWQDQSSLDAAQLPAGDDSYNIAAPVSDQAPAPVPAPLDPNLAGQTFVDPQLPVTATAPAYLDQSAATVYPDPQSGIAPVQPQPALDPATGQPLGPESNPSLFQPQPAAMGPQQQFSSAPSDYPQALDSGPIPPGNTLDLSNQYPAAGLASAQVDPAYPAPANQAYPDNPLAGPPVDFGLSNNALANDMASQQASGGKKSLKFIIIGIVAVVIIALVSLGAVLLSRSSSKPAVDLVEKEVVVPTDPETKNADTQTAEIPAGYQEVDRDCFNFGVLLPTTVDFSKKVCQMAAKYGSVSQYSLTITPFTEPVVDLQNLVDKAKVAGTIVTQDDIELDGVKSKKLIIKSNGLDQQTIVTIPDKKTYQLDGKIINAFIITTSHNDDTAKKASEVLISTWLWM